MHAHICELDMCKHSQCSDTRENVNNIPFCRPCGNLGSQPTPLSWHICLQKIDIQSEKPAMPAASHRMLRKINVFTESRMMICGQGSTERWARADNPLRGGCATAGKTAEVRPRGRAGSASRLFGGGGGQHGYMACTRSVWSSAASYLCDAVGAGVVGEKRRRTCKLNWSRMMRSMRCGWQADHGGEHV